MTADQQDDEEQRPAGWEAPVLNELRKLILGGGASKGEAARVHDGPA
jgi:hypothetical protein